MAKDSKILRISKRSRSELHSKHFPPSGAVHIESPILTQVKRFHDTAIFVAGDVILDEYIFGVVHRISPEAPVPVIHHSAKTTSLGGAANVAANITSFGAQAFLAGRIGSDEHGKELLKLCEKYSIRSSGIVTSSTIPTCSKIRVTSGTQQIVRIDNEIIEPLKEKEERFILQSFKAFIYLTNKPKVLILSDYGKGVLTPTLTRMLISHATQNNISIVTDPKSLDFTKYNGSTLIKPNWNEAVRFYERSGKPLPAKDSSKDRKRICDYILKNTKIANVALSLSENGAYLQGKLAQAGFHCANKEIKLADVSGAGDTMVAFLAMGLATGFPIQKTLEMANLAAGLVCEKPGTATLTTEELLIAHNEHSQKYQPDKLISIELARYITGLFQRNDKTVGFTNGCFDLIHRGNLHLLQQAKRQCDILIVGLNTDEGFYKVRGRAPIQKQDDRAAILASLACVDYVVLFSEKRADYPLEQIQPNLYFKGDLSPGQKIPESEILYKLKIEFRLIPAIPGYSSTDIRKKVVGS